MVARVLSACFDGYEVCPVHVEAEILNGFSAFFIVGMAQTDVLESRTRVRAALDSLGYRMPVGKIVVNLFPAALPKRGSYWDLPLSIALLKAMAKLPPQAGERDFFLGELSLDGRILPLEHSFALLAGIAQIPDHRVFLPFENAEEAGRIPGLHYKICHSLAQLVEELRGGSPSPSFQGSWKNFTQWISHGPRQDFGDYIDLQGQPLLKRVLMLAAIGRHSLLLIGPPGNGKTMALKRFGGILPPLSSQEIMERLRLTSHCLDPSLREAIFSPVRFPHPDISVTGLIGGGRPIQPGEVSLAHRGTLILDELPLFSRKGLELLRQPWEEHEISLNRGGRILRFPADFQLVAAMNPCPCGYEGDPLHNCSCRPYEILRYRKRLSQPFLDRFGLILEVQKGKGDDRLSTDIMKKKVREGRRFLEENKCSFTKEAKAGEDSLCQRFSLSRRFRSKMEAVARSIGALDGRDRVEEDMIFEAFSYQRARFQYWPDD